MHNLKVYQQNLQEKGYTVEIKLGFGKSASTISNIINQTDADILVMGAHGHMGLKDFIFGSTVDKVRHQVKIPVLIIK
jgi:manganese transport protein